MGDYLSMCLSFQHVRLNNNDIFCLYIFIKIQMSRFQVGTL